MVISTLSVTWLRDQNCKHIGAQGSNICQQNPNKLVRESSPGTTPPRAAMGEQQPEGHQVKHIKISQWEMLFALPHSRCLCPRIWDLLGMLGKITLGLYLQDV